MKYLGIDYGTKKIGVAVSDDTGSLAFPLGTVKAGQGALEEIAKLAHENAVHKVIIGESRDNKGQPNEVMEDIGQFKEDIGKLTGLPVEYEREYFTSTMAARQFAPQAKSRKANPSHATLDASAAALILQSYLDKNKK